MLGISPEALKPHILRFIRALGESQDSIIITIIIILVKTVGIILVVVGF